ncbi:hypothetical protein AVEN_127438-1 [Araneus ventricosus]|uniref:Uncharacterized protein n=1 Tax=Araneus ventricosus TaxID=182803 RepID=A0A4Y2EVL4_ARAVE|nr:hypothetical protein AVEN_127438-1 [Araneus ventricosus]
MFENGRTDEDTYHDGMNEDAVTNRCVTEIEFSCEITHKIIIEHFEFRKVCIRWVPRLLTKENKAQQWLLEVGREYFEYGIEKLVPRLDKCLNKKGDYVEK